MFKLIKWSKIISRGPSSWLLYSIATDYGQQSIHAYTYSEYWDKPVVKKIPLRLMVFYSDLQMSSKELRIFIGVLY